MWPRVVEAMLGIWLALSPFIFSLPAAQPSVWANDFICATLIVVFSLATFYQPLRWTRFGTLAVSLWLIAYGRINEYPIPAYHQNHIVLGLLLLMFAIMPTEALQPPPSWRKSR